MFIYKITNNITKKVYTGQTIRCVDKRWSEHCKKNSGCLAVYSTIKKHGKGNFTIEEIDGANSQSELNYLEDFYICKFNTLSPNGYNLKRGGKVSGISKDTKNKQSISQKKRFENLKEREKTSKLTKLAKSRESVKKRQSQSQKRRFSSIEEREKSSISHGGKVFEVFKVIKYTGNPKHKNFKIIDTIYSGEWVNQKECAKYLNLCSKSVNSCLKKNIKHHKLYIFKYK